MDNERLCAREECGHRQGAHRGRDGMGACDEPSRDDDRKLCACIAFAGAAESKAREEEMQATIGRLGKEVIDLSEERDRLKGELAEARRQVQFWMGKYRGANNRARARAAEDCQLLECPPGGPHASHCHLAAPSPAESTGVPGERVYCCPSCACEKGITDRQVVDKPGVCPFCGGDARCTVPAIIDLHAALKRRLAAAAPPDDIRERLDKLEQRQEADGALLLHLGNTGALHADVNRIDLKIDDHDRRLRALEGRETVEQQYRDHAAAQSAAPQEQAGHAFVQGPLDPSICGYMVSALVCCARFPSHPIHTGAKP